MDDGYAAVRFRASVWIAIGVTVLAFITLGVVAVSDADDTPAACPPGAEVTAVGCVSAAAHAEDEADSSEPVSSMRSGTVVVQQQPLPRQVEPVSDTYGFYVP